MGLTNLGKREMKSEHIDKMTNYHYSRKEIDQVWELRVIAREAFQRKWYLS